MAPSVRIWARVTPLSAAIFMPITLAPDGRDKRFVHKSVRNSTHVAILLFKTHHDSIVQDKHDQLIMGVGRRTCGMDGV